MNVEAEPNLHAMPAGAAPRLLIAWEHGANLGHLARLLPIAQSMRNDGCDIVFVVAHVAAGVYVQRLGYAWRQAPAPLQTSVRSGATLNFADILLRIGFDAPERASQAVRHWQQLFDVFKPTIVLVDQSPLAHYAAQASGVPSLVLGHGFEIPSSIRPLPCFAPWQAEAVHEAAACEQSLETSLAALAARVCAADCGFLPSQLHELYRQETSALCVWPELDHVNRPSADPIAYVGPIWSDMPLTPVVTWPSRPKAQRILCYLNLVDKRFDHLWQALARRNANVLVISPFGNAKACAAARGWGVEVVEHAVQIESLVRDAAAVIGHGGMGLTSMALAFGKPVLLLPVYMEQFILAHRLHRRGLALATVRYRSKKTMEAVVDRLMDPALRSESAVAFAEKYGAHRPQDAVDRVKALLWRQVKKVVNR